MLYCKLGGGGGWKHLKEDVIHISNTRGSVSEGYPCTKLKIRQQSIFDEIRGVWIADETLSLYISSQSPKKK